MIWSLPFTWILVNLLVIPSLFYFPTLDYLNLPRGVFWVCTTTFFLIYQYWKGEVQPLTKVDRISALMLIFISWSALSSTWAWQSELTWLRLTFILLAYITFCWVRSFNDQQKNALLWTMAIQGSLLAILGFLQFLEIKPFSEILQTDKPGLTMGHRNVAAEYLLLCLGAGLSRLKCFRQWQTYVALFLSLLCFGIICFTKCRGVLLGMMLATTVYFVYLCILSKSKFLKIGTAVLFIVCISLGYFVVQAKFIGVKESFSSGKMESIQMRIAHYTNTLVLIKENLPTGVGLGNFAIQYSQYLNSWVPDKHYSDRLILRNTHSDPLEVLAELGPIGLCLGIMILWVIFIKYRKTHWSEQVLWWALLAQIFNSCVNFPFQVIQTQMAIALILGCFLSSEPYGKNWTFSIPKRKLIKIIVCGALLYNFFHHIQRIQASQEAQKGINYLLAKRPKEAEPYFRKSVSLDPRQVDHIMLLAYCLKDLGRTTESSSLAENVLGFFSAYLPAYNLIGLNALKINDLNRAVRAFEQSYFHQKFQESTKEKLAVAYVKLSIEFRKRGYIKEARGLEHRLRVIRPNQIDSLRREALDCINLKLIPEAEKIIQDIKKIEDNEKLAYLEARVNIAKQSWVLAIEAIDRGLKKQPTDKKLLLLKSEIQQRFLRKK